MAFSRGRSPINATDETRDAGRLFSSSILSPCLSGETAEKESISYRSSGHHALRTLSLTCWHALAVSYSDMYRFIMQYNTPFVSASVGTPPQPIGLAVDLQDGFIAFLVPNTTNCVPLSKITSAVYNCAADDYCATMGYFCPATSSTMKSIQPSKSDPEGPVNADVVTVGSQRVEGVHMWLNDISPGGCKCSKINTGGQIN